MSHLAHGGALFQVVYVVVKKKTKKKAGDCLLLGLNLFMPPKALPRLK